MAVLANIANIPLPAAPIVKAFDQQAVAVASGSTNDYIFGPIVAPTAATQVTLWPLLEAGSGTVTVRLYVELLNRVTGGAYEPYATAKYVQIPDTPVANYRELATTDTAVIPIVLAGPPYYFRVRAETQAGAGTETASFSLMIRFEGHFGVRG